MNAHEHRYNATPITTSKSPWLRCRCGAWSARGRVAAGKPPLDARVAKGLDTQLARAIAPLALLTAAPAALPAPIHDTRHEPDTTPSVDAVLAGRRLP